MQKSLCNGRVNVVKKKTERFYIELFRKLNCNTFKTIQRKKKLL